MRCNSELARHDQFCGFDLGWRTVRHDRPRWRMSARRGTRRTSSAPEWRAPRPRPRLGRGDACGTATVEGPGNSRHASRDTAVLLAGTRVIKNLSITRLTTPKLAAYIRPHTARRRFGAMARLRSSSLMTVTSHRLYLGRRRRLRRLSGLSRGGEHLVLPGCLTGESEERETWTAESLRAACSWEEIPVSCGWTRLRRYTFQVNTIIREAVSACAMKIASVSMRARRKVGPRQTL